MALFEDETLPLTPSSDGAPELRFKLAWLNRRVENLEQIVFELLRNRVHYDLVNGYSETLRNPGFGPMTMFIKDRGEQIVAQIDQHSSEKLGWPAKETK